MQRSLVMKLTLLSVLITSSLSKKYTDNKDKPDWARKDIRDYSDADLERLLDQWEEDEEPLPDDELPEYLRKPAPLDMSKLDMSKPEEIMKASKKGQTVMMFVSVSNNPKRSRTESLTKLWQTSLWNNHIQAERYLINDDRAIFMFKDGAQAWIAKDFLIEQEECKLVTLESQTYNGNLPNKINDAIKDEL